MRLNIRKSIVDGLVNEAVRVLNISPDEAERRIERIVEMEWLKQFGGPGSKKYQTAVDIIMQIPSREPVTVEAMKKVVEGNANKKS